MPAKTPVRPAAANRPATHSIPPLGAFCVALLALLATPASAQSDATGGSTAVITTPPRSLQDAQIGVTQGADSTLWSDGVGGPASQHLQVQLPPGVIGGGGGGGGGGGTSGDPVCAASGGPQYSPAPVSLIVSVGGTNYSLGATFSGRGTTTDRGRAGGSAQVRITYGGVTKTVTVTCPMSLDDVCEASANADVGAGSFAVSISTTTPLAGDWVFGKAAPYSGQVSVSQMNCTP